MILWVNQQLRHKTNPLDLSTALTTLQILLRKDDFRVLFYKADGLNILRGLLKTQHSNVQLLYQTIYCLWLLSYNSSIAENFSEMHHKHDPTTLIYQLVLLLKTVAKDKIIRMDIATLRNLLDKNNNNEQMIETNLLKEVEKLQQRKWGDDDITEDLKVLQEILQKEVLELSSWAMYKQELISGSLEWTPVHRSEKFWRENAVNFEENNHRSLTFLLGMLVPETDPKILAIACHDLGEFVRFHPRGKTIIQNMGGKDPIMKLMSHPDPDVQKHALLCLQKLMVHNWEYLSR